MFSPTKLTRLHTVVDKHPVLDWARAALNEPRLTIIGSRMTGMFFLAVWINKHAGIYQELPSGAPKPHAFKRSTFKTLGSLGKKAHKSKIKEHGHNAEYLLHREANEHEDRQRAKKDRVHWQKNNWKRGNQINWDRLYPFL